jgi:NTE family protein
MSARVIANRTARKSHRQLARPPFECIALLLQGGGALGAYQAGVYEALSEAHLAPDWVAGISIGAVNAALIAGNPPIARVFASNALTGQSLIVSHGWFMQ